MGVDNDVVLAARLAQVGWRGPSGVSALQGPQVGAVDGGANGRYDQARGNRKSAYTGRYTVNGNHIDYIDDTGVTATGDVRDGVLHREAERPDRSA
ncbi:Atu4866 domain-containing protein [Streptomyces sp. NPDC058107]|uniref:Atu4866 domain-containing protein n=1 Tax=Streptomyces sp. NPDC058107 TaxID=3346343 RepID=UPI0036E4B383